MELTDLRPLLPPGRPLPELLDPKEVVSIEEPAISNINELESWIEVLVEKGIESKEEMIEETKKLKKLF